MVKMSPRPWLAITLLMTIPFSGCQESPSAHSSAQKAVESTGPKVNNAKTVTTPTHPLPTANETANQPQTPSPTTRKSASSVSQQEVVTPPANGESNAPKQTDQSVPGTLFSQAHHELSNVEVGDPLPEVTLKDIAGTERTLKEWTQDKVSILIFWNEDSPIALEQFQRIPIDILANFEQEAYVFTINVGDEPSRVRALTGDAADRITSLLDPDRTVFEQFAKARIPRVYVVGRDGNVVWFDLEYSQSTERSLAQVLSELLRQSS